MRGSEFQEIWRVLNDVVKRLEEVEDKLSQIGVPISDEEDKEAYNSCFDTYGSGD